MGGFAVSPDGSQLALAVASAHDDSSASTVASQILVINLRTGAHEIWRGGLDRTGQTFGIVDLSWTGDGKSLVYLAKWCPPNYLGYGLYGGFNCSTLGHHKHPVQFEGSQAVREVSVTTGGGTLNQGPVLLSQSARNMSLTQALINPGGTQLYALFDSRGSVHGWIQNGTLHALPPFIAGNSGGRQGRRLAPDDLVSN